MNLQEAVAEAITRPTLLDALSWIAVWECDRAVRQACTSGGYDTCFRRSFDELLTAWNTKPRWKMNQTHMSYEEKVKFCFHAVCKRQPELGANAEEVAQEMRERGWLSPLDTVIDIADILREWLGRPTHA